MNQTVPKSIVANPDRRNNSDSGDNNANPVAPSHGNALDPKDFATTQRCETLTHLGVAGRIPRGNLTAIRSPTNFGRHSGRSSFVQIVLHLVPAPAETKSIRNSELNLLSKTNTRSASLSCHLLCTTLQGELDSLSSRQQYPTCSSASGRGQPIICFNFASKNVVSHDAFALFSVS